MLNKSSNTFIKMVQTSYNSFVRFMRRNANALATFLIIVTPVLFLWLGIDSTLKRGCFAIGGEWFLVPFWLLIIWGLKSYSRVHNCSLNFPVPIKRFTTVSNDGEVYISEERLQELLIFVADYEDWLEDTGIVL